MFKSYPFKNIKTDFNNKHYILTGYSSGIGKQIYKDLKSLGAIPILVGRKSIKNEIFYFCDLRDLAETEIATFELSKKFKKIDGFIHCAGINQCVQSDKINLDDWQNILNVNLSSAFIISKGVKTNLKKSKNPSVIFFSSIAGHRKSIVSGVHYVSSKAGLIGMAKQLSHEFGQFGIRVNCVSPGPVKTKLAQKVHTPDIVKAYHDSIPLNRYGMENEIAEAIFFLSSEKASYITGQNLSVDGGFEASGVGLISLRES